MVIFRHIHVLWSVLENYLSFIVVFYFHNFPAVTLKDVRRGPEAHGSSSALLVQITCVTQADEWGALARVGAILIYRTVMGSRALSLVAYWFAESAFAILLPIGATLINHGLCTGVLREEFQGLYKKVSRLTETLVLINVIHDAILGVEVTVVV
jgi:hypothetical protein